MVCPVGRSPRSPSEASSCTQQLQDEDFTHIANIDRSELLKRLLGG